MAARQDATESRCDRTVVVYGVQFHEVGQLRVARDGIEESLQHVVQAAAVDDWRGQRGEWCCGGDKARYAVPADGESPGPDQSPLMSNDLPRQENADAETIRVGCFGGRQERRFHEHVRLRGAPDEVAKARVIARKLGGRNGTDFNVICAATRGLAEKGSDLASVGLGQHRISLACGEAGIRVATICNGAPERRREATARPKVLRQEQ
jgi:hypothetical protein